MDCIPLPIICIQCGTNQNPCHCKIVGPTIGFGVAVVMAVSEIPFTLLSGNSRLQRSRLSAGPLPFSVDAARPMPERGLLGPGRGQQAALTD